MALRIAFIVSLGIFVFGVIGIYQSISVTDLEPPGSAGLFTRQTAIFLSYPIGAFLTCSLLEKLLKRGTFWISLVLPFTVLGGLTISFFYISDWFETRDLEKNGIVLETTIDSTAFKWNIGHHDNSLYYTFSYGFSLNDSAYQFKQWRLIHDHSLTVAYNPKVDYSMLPQHKLRHPGDTLRLWISTVNPWRQRVLKRP